MPIWIWAALGTAAGADLTAWVDDDAVLERVGFAFPEAAPDAVDARCVASVAVDGEGKVAKVAVTGCDAPWSGVVEAGFAGWRFAPVKDAENKPTPASGEYVVRFRKDKRGARVRVVPRTVVRVVERHAAPYPSPSIVAELGTQRLDCTMNAVVGTDGKTTAAVPLDCPDNLVKTSADALLRWKWEPVGDAPFQTNVTFRFQLSAADFEQRKLQEQLSRDNELAEVLDEVPRANLDKTTIAPPIAFPSGVKAGRYTSTECDAIVLADASGVPQTVDVSRCEGKWAEAARDGLLQYRFSPPATLADEPMQPLVQRYRVTFKRYQDKRETGGVKTIEEATVKERRTTIPAREVTPKYPPEAYEEGVEVDRCQIDLLISAKGRLETQRAFACPDVVLHPAITALQDWKFQPVVVDGKPIRFKTTLGIGLRRDAYEWKYVDDFDHDIPDPPPYPADRPAADTFPMVHPATITVKKRVPLALSDLDGLSPEEGAICKAVLYADELGKPFHVEIGECPDAMRYATYRALMQWSFEPMEIEEAQVPVRFPQTVKFSGVAPPDPIEKK